MASKSIQETTSTLEGNYKVAYHDSIIEAIPDDEMFTKMTPISTGRLGREFRFPVIVQRGQGFSYIGPTNAVAVTLNPAVSSQMKEATVNAGEIMYRDQILTNAVARAVKSPAMFKEALGVLMMNSKRTCDARLEWMNWYGGQGVFDFLTTAVLSGSAGSRVLQIQAKEWSAGASTAFENAWVEFRRTATPTTTQGNAAVFRITKFDGVNQRMTIQEVNATTGVDITVDTNAAQLATDLGANAGTCWFYGSQGNEADGVKKMLSLASGNLLGIDVATFRNWSGNLVTVSGTASLDHLGTAINVLTERGYTGDLVVFVSPAVWALIHKNLPLVQRVFDSSYNPNKVETGSQKIVYHNQNGFTAVCGHRYIKSGDMFLLPGSQNSLSTWKRLGGNDWTNSIPGSDGRLFNYVDGTNYWSYAYHTLQAPFTFEPWSSAVINGFALS